MEDPEEYAIWYTTAQIEERQYPLDDTEEYSYNYDNDIQWQTLTMTVALSVAYYLTVHNRLSKLDLNIK